MITLLKLSIFVLSASLTIASKRCCRNVKKLKKQNKQLQLQNEELESTIKELETDGEWGSWSSWSDCRSSSFCGKGFTTRSRSCTPQGKYCEGDTVEAQKCDIKCPTSGLNKSDQGLWDPTENQNNPTRRTSP